MKRKINGYNVETVGGFITVKHWIVTDSNDEFKGIFFKFNQARTACLTSDFSEAYHGRLY